jgi:hypothetical protein
LADRIEQQQILGAGEDPTAGPWVVIDHALQIGGEVRRALDLVEDRAVGELREEGTRIAGGEVAHVEGFQRDVGLVREDRPAEGGLPALPRRTGSRSRGTVLMDPDAIDLKSADSKSDFESADKNALACQEEALADRNLWPITRSMTGLGRVRCRSRGA